MALFGKYDEDQLAQMYSLHGAEEKEAIDFWRENLMEFSLNHGQLTFSIDRVMTEFTVDGLVPGFFDKSLAILRTKKDVICVDDLATKEESSLVKAFSSIWTSIFQQGEDVSNLRYISSKLLVQLKGYISIYIKSMQPNELAFSRQSTPNLDFQSLVERSLNQIANTEEKSRWLSWYKKLSLSDKDTIVSYLVDQKCAIASDKVIVLLTDSASPSLDTATAYLDVKITLQNITKRLQSLHEQIQTYTVAAVAAKSRSDTQSALVSLKLRKNAESLKQRLLQAQYNLEESLQSIEGVEINNIVINAYSSASKALKSSREEANMTAESVEIAMEAFNEEMDQFQEINDAITSSSIAQISEEESEELEKELASIMLAESTTSVVRPTPPVVLPSVPSAKIPARNQKVENEVMLDSTVSTPILG